MNSTEIINKFYLDPEAQRALHKLGKIIKLVGRDQAEEFLTRWSQSHADEAADAEALADAVREIFF